MRKLFVFNRISLDGFFAGPNGEIDWFVDDDPLDKVIHDLMSPDTALFGRTTYQMFESFWPDAAKDPNSPEKLRRVGQEMNEMIKLVFSKTLNEVTWENSELLKGDPVDEVARLKQGNGADLVIFGSGSLVQQLTAKGLIDEFLIVVSPVVLDTGKSMFTGSGKRSLKLLQTQAFDTGNVLLRYGRD